MRAGRHCCTRVLHRPRPLTSSARVGFGSVWFGTGTWSEQRSQEMHNTSEDSSLEKIFFSLIILSSVYVCIFGMVTQKLYLASFIVANAHLLSLNEKLSITATTADMKNRKSFTINKKFLIKDCAHI